MFSTAYRIFDEAVYRLVLCVIGAGAAFAVVLALYTVKSAMGIDLMDGPSFMHEFYMG